MKTSIGERIRIRRKELKITQTQIQEEIGISSGNLSGIESGKSLPSTSALIGLSKILDCTTDWILTGNPPMLRNKAFSDIEDFLISGYRELPEDDKEELINILKMKLKKISKATNSMGKSSILTDIDTTVMIG